jgi:hypothetical protein
MSRINYTLYTNEALRSDELFAQNLCEMRNLTGNINTQAHPVSNEDLDNLEDLLEKLTQNHSNMTIAEDFLKKYTS